MARPSNDIERFQNRRMDLQRLWQAAFFIGFLRRKKRIVFCDRTAIDLPNADWLRPRFLPTTTVVAILLKKWTFAQQHGRRMSERSAMVKLAGNGVVGRFAALAELSATRRRRTVYER
jgi:hypothetical protein